MRIYLAAALTALAIAVAPLQGFGQAPATTATPQTFIYPAKGQKPEQQEKDKTECYAWSSKQTGYDPVKALQEQQAQAAQTQQQQQQAQQQAQQSAQNVGGERVGGAVKGAAGGAIIGAIAGDAGKGAAIGAATGTMAGGARQRGKKKAVAQEQQQSQQQIAQQQSQQQAAANQKFADYTRGFNTCMEGRGYTIK